MKKNVRLRARETNATNSDFYNLFRPIAPSIDLIGKVAQVISALTEGVTIWFITQSEMAEASKAVSITVSILAMLLVIAVLELGGRKFLQVLTRAVVWKRLKNAWYIALFSIVTIITIGVGVLSFNLSTNGIRHAFTAKVPVVAQFDATELKSEYRNNVKEISLRHKGDYTLIRQNYEERLASLSDRYDARIDAAKAKVASYRDKYQNGAKWAKSQANKYEKRALALETEKTTAVAALQKEHSQKLDAFQAKKDQALAAEKARLDKSIAKAETALAKTHASRTKRASFWGNLFSLFVGCSVVLAFICIVSVEVFRRGAGIEVTYDEEEMETPAWSLIWNGLRTRFNRLFRRLAMKIAGGDDETGSTTGKSIGYNYNRNNMAVNQADDESLGY